MPGRYHRFTEDSEYLREMKRSWDKLLKEAFKKLPPVAWSDNWDNQQDIEDEASEQQF
jgi:predicted proteasome-type protease